MSGAADAATFLFVPGDRPDRFDKAAAAGADVVVLDLEDAVAPDRREQARADVAEWLAAGSRAAVRVNATGHPDHAADVAALAGAPSGLLAVVVAKAEDPAALTRVHEATGAGVVALVESAVGVADARALARAPGVVRLAFGSLDYALDLDAEHVDAVLAPARSALVLASRVAGLTGPVDGVTTDVTDPEAARSDAAAARRVGFAGKLLIHPRQVAPATAAFTPTDEETTWATRVLEAAEAMAREGRGAVALDGEMLDAPVVERARRIAARSRPEGDPA